MADDATLRIVVDGIKWELDLNDLSALDARDFRAVTGTRLFDAARAPDLDHVAAFIWLQRRRTERSLTFDQVARDVTLGGVDAPEDMT